MGYRVLHVQIPEELDAKLTEMVEGLTLVTGKRATKKGLVVKALEKSAEVYDSEYSERVEAERQRKIESAEALF